MRSSKEIFWRRLKDDWKSQITVFRTAVNWVVWLYILVPFSIAGVYNYLLLWQGDAGWGYLFSYSSVIVILFLLSWSGNIRLFVEFADQLVLRQKPVWMDGLIKRGIQYSLVISFITSSFVYALFSPLLLMYIKIPTFHYFLLFFAFILLRVNLIFIKSFANIYYSGWKFVASYIVILILTIPLITVFIIFEQAVVYMMIDIILFIIAISLYRLRRGMKWSFIEDCHREKENSLFLTRLLLRTATMIGGEDIKKQSRMTRPLILTKSKHIFRKRTAENLLVEIYFKTIFRSIRQLYFLLQILGIFVAGILAMPIWMKWLIWGFSIFFLSNYFKGSWLDLIHEQFIKMLPIKEEIKFRARKKSILYSMVPFMLILGMLTGTLTISYLFGFLVSILGIVLTHSLLRFN